MVEAYGVDNVYVNKLKDLEVVEMLKELCEVSKKKNKKLLKKMKSEAYVKKSSYCVL